MIKGSSSLCLPANKTWVSVGFSKNHTAEDFGWLSKYPASKYQDLVAVSDGEIIAHHKYSDGGNTVVLGWNYGNHDYYALYMHNKDQSPLKVGTVVKQGDPIAVMGKTGKSRGEHVHLILIKAPKGSKYDNNALRKYRIAPSSYPMYVYPGQEIVSGKVNIKPLPKVEEVKSDKAVIKKGAKSKSLSAKYNNLSIARSAIGVPLDYELNKVKGKDWVYFPTIQTYVDIKDVDFNKKPQNKPQKPVSNVGKTAQLRGNVNLYPNANTKIAYGIPSGRPRNLKILDEANGRLKVKSTAFNPQTVWVNAKDVKIV